MSIEIYEFIKDHGSTLVAFVALVALGYQIYSANRQFGVLNRGYLNAFPNLSPSLDTLDHTVHVQTGGQLRIDPNARFDGINLLVPLENMGNLPFKYEVKKFDVWINDVLRTAEFAKNDNTLGVLFPKQQGKYFQRAGIRINENGQGVAYGEIMSWRIKIHLEVHYHEYDEERRKLDRDYDFYFFTDGGKYVETTIRDKW
jgi:hypothetical protein